MAPAVPDRAEVRGKRVTVMGLGLFGGGAGVARFFARRGADVVVTDLRDEDELRDAVESLAGLPLTFRLGRHEDADFIDTDLVVVNPAVPPTSKFLRLALDAGVPLDTEINILFRLCPAPIVAVTGSNGKSTTTAMIAGMLEVAGLKVWLGGNLGGSLLEATDEMTPDDVGVLELSSFELERLTWTGLSPHVAVVSNLTPNHLDRHKTMANYVAAKKPIFLNQRSGDTLIVNRDDEIVADWLDEAPAGVRKLSFGKADPPPGAENITLRHAEGVFRLDGKSGAVALDGLRLPGEHNRLNAIAAALAAVLLGAGRRHIEDALAAFEGLPHRLEFVAEHDGVRYYNDSIATNPESVMVALRSFESGIILIAGGHDKDLDYDELARMIVKKVKHTVLLGTGAEKIHQALRDAGAEVSRITRAASFDEGVAEAVALAEAGDVVLMSPACASYDMFCNFEERARRFVELVQEHIAARDACAPGAA